MQREYGRGGLQTICRDLGADPGKGALRSIAGMAAWIIESEKDPASNAGS
jgi:hypothetical protein